MSNFKKYRLRNHVKKNWPNAPEFVEAYFCSKKVRWIVKDPADDSLKEYKINTFTKSYKENEYEEYNKADPA